MIDYTLWEKKINELEYIAIETFQNEIEKKD